MRLQTSEPLVDRLRTESDAAAKRDVLGRHFDDLAEERDRWKARNRYYHAEIEKLCRSFIPPGSAVLELGSSTGDLLNALDPDPQKSVGIDLSPKAVAIASRKYPQLNFRVGDAENLDLPEGSSFDFVLMSDVVGHLHDLYATFRKLRQSMRSDTRLIVTYYNFLWEGVLQLAERVGLKMPQHYQNWLSMADLENLFYLSDYGVEKKGTAVLVPKNFPFVSQALNAIAPRTPGLRGLCLVQYFVGRPRLQSPPNDQYGVTVVVPCRNEAGNIASAAERLPPMGSHTEMIYVDGQSTDGTVDEIQRVMERYRGKIDIKLIHQVPRDVSLDVTKKERPDLMLKLGKGDAVRKGFAAASGDVLMILDSDLTVAPEDLPRFFDVLAEGKATFVNGSRLVYAMQDQSMRFLNLVGNKFFSLVFSWLLRQPIKDTLCGTKVLFKRDYQRIEQNRAYFGEFDPFGDFDLLFGAAHAGLKIVDMPIRYRARVAGVSKVRLMSHGILLMKMTLIGFRKLKLRKWFGKQ
jgi:SAM-dependent methyltransferase/glycosyltransferase involved in cell wall biosynthesis